jgi:hypothetical protein
LSLGAANWRAGDRSSVETRAYPYFMGPQQDNETGQRKPCLQMFGSCSETYPLCNYCEIPDTE